MMKVQQNSLLSLAYHRNGIFSNIVSNCQKQSSSSSSSSSSLSYLWILGRNYYTNGATSTREERKMKPPSCVVPWIRGFEQRYKEPYFGNSVYSWRCGVTFSTSSKSNASTTNHQDNDADADTASNDPIPENHPVSTSLPDWRFCKEKPTLKYAKAMPRTFSAMNHEQILQLCVEGRYEARREALVRNIMAVDDIEHEEACQKVLEIAEENRKMMHWEYSPYHMGIFAALVSGGLSFPLIFDKQTVLWFNRHFVTAEVPDAADLETIWEVGSWSWGWMEPVIGQASFVLLVLQFARSQAMKLGMKPYGDAMLSWRSKRLVKKYPQYDAMFVEWFAESEAIYGSHKMKE